jgi:hypothetical protein
MLVLCAHRVGIAVTPSHRGGTFLASLGTDINTEKGRNYRTEPAKCHKGQPNTDRPGRLSPRATERNSRPSAHVLESQVEERLSGISSGGGSNARASATTHRSYAWRRYVQCARSGVLRYRPLSTAPKRWWTGSGSGSNVSFKKRRYFSTQNPKNGPPAPLDHTADPRLGLRKWRVPQGREGLKPIQQLTEVVKAAYGVLI